MSEVHNATPFKFSFEAFVAALDENPDVAIKTFTALAKKRAAFERWGCIAAGFFVAAVFFVLSYVTGQREPDFILNWTVVILTHLGIALGFSLLFYLVLNSSSQIKTWSQPLGESGFCQALERLVDKYPSVPILPENVHRQLYMADFIRFERATKGVRHNSKAERDACARLHSKLGEPPSLEA